MAEAPSLKAGDALPGATFFVMGAEGVEPLTTEQLCAGRTVVLVGVPGAFTPTCHRNHLPGYVEHADILKAKGIDTIAVTAVNDVFVMDAWARATGGAGRIEFLADGSGDFARAIGMAVDASARGLGLRSKRYVIVVRDGVVETLAVEDNASRTDVSSAEALLATLADGPAIKDEVEWTS